MPLQITRPRLGLEHVKQNVRPKAQQLTGDLADLAQGSLQSYTPNKWKKLLYKAVSNKGRIRGGWGVGGPLGPNGLMPTPMTAPRGTIAQFLMNHPEYAKRNRGKGRRRSFPMAWWHLPKEAKELLRDERLAGMYHSRAPAAPYWQIAEEGMERVGVPARYYIQNSRAAIERAVPMLSDRTWDSL